MRMQRPILLCHNCQTLCLCGFIALAQKSNTNIDIINHNILRGQAKAFQIITNNTTLGKKMKFYNISIFLMGITSMEATSVSNSNAKEDKTLSSYASKVDVQSSTSIVIADNDSDEDSPPSLLHVHGGMKEEHRARARVSVCSFSLAFVFLCIVTRPHASGQFSYPFFL